MKNKWINYGENPTEGEAIFVQVNPENGLTQEIDVVRITPYELENPVRKRYSMEVASYSWQDLRERFLRKNSREYKSFDWQKYEGRKFEDIVGLLAADVIMNAGGQTEGDSGSNCWELLHKEGIRRDNVTF